MKKIITVIMMSIILCYLTGCAKVVDTQYSEVEVTVADAYYNAGDVTPIISTNGSMSYVFQPTIYKIIVTYGDSFYTFSGKTTYYKYCNKVGETVIATLKTDIYDDGTESYWITELQ